MSTAATVFFAAAILHTFLVSVFARAAGRARPGSTQAFLLHFLSEVELVFGIWALGYLVWLALNRSMAASLEYLTSRSFYEPLFVVVIMTICATKPVLRLAELTLGRFKNDFLSFGVIMVVGPLLGSLITEPAAMTVAALLLVHRFYSRTESLKFKYAMTGLLFVNISIGGALTSFAAPPILMVARAWGWDTAFVFTNFGWKAIVAILVSTAIVGLRFRNEIRTLRPTPEAAPGEMQSPLDFTAGLKVGIFLAGLVVLGGPQGWWIEPLLTKLDRLPLFLGAMGLTALTDNAALTYLGTLVPMLTTASKYVLVAGAITGGGLTVIANAPNPAGASVLNRARVFGGAGMGPFRLLASALVPTFVAAVCFWFL